MLESRLRTGTRVFELSESTLQHQHQSLRDKLGLDLDFVLHSLRHTMLTILPTIEQAENIEMAVNTVQ